MEFQAREDIEAPIEFVFGQITDFESFERSIMRRGGDVVRRPGPVPPMAGAGWDVRFRMRGKERRVEARLARVDPGQAVVIDVVSKNVAGACMVELVPLSRSRTRLIVKLSAKATSLAAKLVFQSMRFGKHRTTQRFKSAVAGFAEDVEARYRG